MPDCSISIRYEYSNKVDTSDDESDNSIRSFKEYPADVVTRSGRGTIAEYCLQRWEDASIAAMSKTNNVKKDSTAVNNNTGNK